MISIGKKVKFTKRELLFHLILWKLFAIGIFYFDPLEDTIITQVFALLISVASYMLGYYGQFYISCNYYYANRKSRAIVSTMLILCTTLMIDTINFHFVIDLFRKIGNAFTIGFVFKFALGSIIVHGIFVVMAIGTYQNKLLLVQLEEKSEREKLLMNKQIGFFKNLFSPHITFNFLSFCYKFCIDSNDNSKEIIEIYSEMLRQTNNWRSNETITLSQEIEYIRNFIRLKKLLTPSLCVEVKTEGDLTRSRILPRLIITQIENAFKHGVTNNPNEPIRIYINCVKGNTESMVSNLKFNTENNTLHSGLGLVNFKNQLEIFYGNNYEYITKDDGYYYRSSLKIIN